MVPIIDIDYQAAFGYRLYTAVLTEPGINNICEGARHAQHTLEVRFQNSTSQACHNSTDGLDGFLASMILLNPSKLLVVVHADRLPTSIYERFTGITTYTKSSLMRTTPGRLASLMASEIVSVCATRNTSKRKVGLNPISTGS